MTVQSGIDALSHALAAARGAAVAGGVGHLDIVPAMLDEAIIMAEEAVRALREVLSVLPRTGKLSPVLVNGIIQFVETEDM